VEIKRSGFIERVPQTDAGILYYIRGSLGCGLSHTGRNQDANP
jgi:hypothetical protein